ncbi:hypothetical protein L2E82_30604 [Cichorium intybus]|uniref:Uncharacterized protein n=1 Tax=Cichorium intybus TaxID=13427 RepID=A0ACB9D0R3_CICIN|nr:hypothetical protein L2E82_30604 [Cichorium intybus]
MHIRKDPSFFFTNKTGAPQGEKLGLMNPLLSSSFSWLDNSCISAGANRYGAFATGVAPGIKSILNSTCHAGGTPGRSSGNTSGKSQTSGISLMFFTSFFSSTTWARKAWYIFCRYF